TRLKTGFGTGRWELSGLKWCARVATKPIVAGGGVRHHGDIAKSVRFGAAMVMVGSLFAGHEESPGQTVEVDGKLYKEYYGSASDFNKGEYKHVEGKRILEPIKGKLADTLREMREDLQSSISYSCGRALADLRKVNYVILGGGNDQLDGGDGDATLIGGGGDDRIDGGAGMGDRMFLRGNFADYAISYDSVSHQYTLVDQVAGRDGTDIVKGVEFFNFADGVKN